MEEKSSGLNYKIRYKAFKDKTELTRIMCDRVESRNYVLEKGFGLTLPKVYAIESDPGRIDFSELPLEFVIKATHGSGGMFFVRVSAPRKSFPKAPRKVKWKTFEINPLDFNEIEAKKWITGWLKLDYSFLPHRDVMWGYGEISGRVIIEELLVNLGGEPLKTLEFWVFNGVVKFIRVKDDKFMHTMEWFTPQWESIPAIRAGYNPPKNEHEKPPNLGEAIAISEKLAGKVDFVRVDLYIMGNKVYFGEFTPYPSAGKQELETPEYDLIWGSYWKVCTY